MLHTQNILIAAVTGESLQWAGQYSGWKKVRTAGQLTQHLSIAIPIMVSLFNNLLASKTSPFLKIVAGTTLSVAGLGVLGLAVSPIAPDLRRSGLLGGECPPPGGNPVGSFFDAESHYCYQTRVIKS